MLVADGGGDAGGLLKTIGVCLSLIGTNGLPLLAMLRYPGVVFGVAVV